MAVLPVSAQTLTVDQMESKWHALYQKGYDAFDSHDYQKAEVLFKECIEFLVSNEAANSPSHINALIKLGETYYASGNTNQQNHLEQQILAIRKNIRPGSKRYVDYLYHLGLYYSNTGRFSKAIPSLEEALSFKETLPSMAGAESRILHRLALCNYCKGNTSLAISKELECIGKDDNKTPEYVKVLAYFYFHSSDWDKLEKVIPDCYSYSRETVLRKFYQSKSRDRASYWSSAGLFFTEYLPSYAYIHPSDVLVSYAYDAALFSKGVLLAAENKSSELTLNSDDPELIKLYSHYLDLKGKKDKNLDEEFEMEALSDVVLKYQKEHKNEYRKDFRIGWKDIQDNLKEGDIAIEFVTIPNENGYDDYAALSIKSGTAAPKLTKLASYQQLSAIPSSDVYSTSRLYDLVWGKLEDELADVQNVYFSPEGIFYNTGIEYVPNEDEISFCATRNVYRLSSTKELAVNKSRKFTKEALFGGINYDTKVSTLANQSPKYEPQSETERGITLDSLDLRGTSTKGGFSFLEGTMEEIGDISMILLDSDVPADMYAGDDGSETAFKNLSGSDIDALHIATHGFYYSSQSIGKKLSLEKLFRELTLHFTSDDIVVINEDKMLTRSGLILAGANNVLKQIPIPKGVEDGVLYAKEIANLNLSNVEFVVLSACQSGLGDIAASEGVFGLQRGFKLAGAHSIIMSLWKVNDDATRILMTEMYKNISLGQSKRKALFNAQMALRLVDDGRFDNPEHWAAFILLDALD